MTTNEITNTSNHPENEEQTMNAAELIAMSRHENRSITHYADSAEEFDGLVLDMTDEADDSVEESGQGYSGPEGRGWISFFADSWRVDLVYPK